MHLSPMSRVNTDDGDGDDDRYICDDELYLEETLTARTPSNSTNNTRTVNKGINAKARNENTASKKATVEISDTACTRKSGKQL